MKKIFNAVNPERLTGFFVYAVTFLFLISSFVIFGVSPAQASPVWTSMLGTPGEDNIWDIALDDAGNVYGAGMTDGAIDGNISNGGRDIVVIKFDPVGNRLWTRQIGTPADDVAFGVAIDIAGNLYVSGRTYGNLGDVNAGGADIFLMKLDPMNGDALWIRQFGSPADDLATRVAVDAGGNAYVTGYTNGGLDGNLNSGGFDMFLVKYDQYGNRQWTSQLGTAVLFGGVPPFDGTISGGVAVDWNNDIYVAGSAQTGLDGNPYYGGQDVVLVKFDQWGNRQWTSQSGTSSNDMGTSVAVSGDGVYVTGNTDGGLDGNPYYGNTDLFVMKYDFWGNKLWTRQVGTPSPDFAFRAVADMPGNVYIAGMLHQALDGNYGYENSCDIGLFEFDPAGNMLLGEKMGELLMDHSFAIGVDQLGFVYIGGQTENNLGGNVNQGGLDIFMMQLDGSGGSNGFTVTPTAGTEGTQIYRFDSQLGSFGAGPGQFNLPFGVAVDIWGNLYVVDGQNNRIQKFDPNGMFLTEWGSFGTGNGQFNMPEEIAVDALGNVYVADSGNNRIQKFDSNGVYLTQWGSFGTGDGQFNYPGGIAVDMFDNLYIADWLNGRIQKFDSNGVFLAQWSCPAWGYDSQGNFIGGPWGVAVDALGYVYVADGRERIRKFDSNGIPLAVWTAPNPANNSAWEVAVDSSGNVYASYWLDNIIIKFDSSGTYLTQWGSAGTGDGQFDLPEGVAVDASGYVYVADMNNNRIQKFQGIFTGSSSEGGSINPATPQTVNYNDMIAFDIMPNPGYSIASVSGCGGTLSGNTYITGPITADCTVSASFAAPILFLTVSATSGPYGSISPSGAVPVPSGERQGFIVTADTGYYPIMSGTCGGTLSGAWPNYTYVTNEITYDCTVHADFNPASFIVTPSPGANGSMTPSAPQTVDYNQTAAFTITPDTGYHIVSVTGCGGTLNGNTYTTAPITADCTVTAIFAINSYTVTPSSGANGSVTPSVPQVVNYNQIAAFTITPDTGYHIASVTGCGGTLSGNTYITGPITADCSVAAIFAINTYTVTPSAGIEGSQIYQFESEWGSLGAGAGQFNSPEGIFMDPSGYIYIADAGNSRIQKFDSNGAFVTEWSYYGRGGTATADNIYVIDTWNNRILKLDAGGNYVGQLSRSFDFPEGVAVDASGNVYVSDTGNSRIQKFDSNGVFLTQWGVWGTGNGEFRDPWGIAVDSSGNVYVADMGNNRIQKFDSNGVYLTQWGYYGAGNGQFNGPFQLAAGPSGDIYVTDTNSGNNRIQKFDSNGVYLTQWAFNTPGGIAVDASGNVYVSDTGNNRVKKFQGIFTGTSSQGGYISPSEPQVVDYNQTASFTITSDTGYHIASVTGCGGTLSGNTYTTGSITADCSVAATFAINTYPLTVADTGSGTGTVSSSPAGISCGSDCSEVYNHGTSVTLTAVPDSDTAFTGWSGGGCSGTGPCTVTMTADTAITAEFTQAITVTSPNGGEIWDRSGIYTITWTYGGAGTSVTIELLKNGAIERIISQDAPIGSNGTGSYAWKIPGQTPGADYTIRITDTANGSFTDASDGYFSISK